MVKKNEKEKQIENIKRLSIEIIDYEDGTTNISLNKSVNMPKAEILGILYSATAQILNSMINH